MTEPELQSAESTEPPQPPEGDPPPEPVDPEPETPDPIPDPEPIIWEPQTWYAVTAACRTPGCRQENIIVDIPMFYSNNGDPRYCRVVCAQDGACGKDATILTATKLDPQPPEE